VNLKLKRRVEMLDAVSTGLYPSAVIGQLAEKYSVSERTLWSDWERREKWIPVLLQLEKFGNFAEMIEQKLNAVQKASWSIYLHADKDNARPCWRFEGGFVRELSFRTTHSFNLGDWQFPRHGKRVLGFFLLKKEIGKARTKIFLSKPVWTVVFQLWRVFSSCGCLLFLSFSEAEVLSGLALLFLLSSACTFLLLTKETDSFSFREVVLAFVQLSSQGFL
jgi:hypothetical protein